MILNNVTEWAMSRNVNVIEMWLNSIANFHFHSGIFISSHQVEEQPTSDELTYLEKLWRNCFQGQQASGDQDWSAPLDPTGKETG